MHDRLPPKRVCSGSRDLFKVWEISDNISETVQGRDIVAMKDQIVCGLSNDAIRGDLE